MMKRLIFGIGNSGSKYEETRHNIGWMFVDFVYSEDNSMFILSKSSSFVNLSGGDIKKVIQKNKIELKDIFVVHDDLDIDFGSYKISFGKNSAGHNGVQSIIDELGSNEFWRLRFGIANEKLAIIKQQNDIEEKQESISRFVLDKFIPSEREKLNELFKTALEDLKNHAR